MIQLGVFKVSGRQNDTKRNTRHIAQGLSSRFISGPGGESTCVWPGKRGCRQNPKEVFTQMPWKTWRPEQLLQGQHAKKDLMASGTRKRKQEKRGIFPQSDRALHTFFLLWENIHRCLWGSQCLCTTGDRAAGGNHLPPSSNNSSWMTEDILRYHHF